MRRLIPCLLVLTCLCSPAPARAAMVSPAPAAASVSMASAEKAADIRIAPHRATYDMSLASVKNGSNISDVSGKMVFEWRDVCDGWAVQQHMKLHFSYSDDGDQDIVSTELTWESKDGKRYDFDIRRTTNGQETEKYKGKAAQNADGTVTVNYTLPKDKVVQLPAGTLFPSSHTILILQKAAQTLAGGDKMFTRRVFDGGDEIGSSDISAFVLPQKPKAEAVGLSDRLKQSPLLAASAWPVHMAFFTPGAENDEPDYEMTLTLLPNGIARHMKIDYGDFTVNGVLADLQALPAAKCQ